MLEENGLVTMLCYITTFIIILKNFKYNEKLLFYIILAATIVSCFGIIESVYGNVIDALKETAVSKQIARATMGNPNFFSTYITLLLPIALFNFFNTNKKWYIYVTSILFAALICSDTLGGYITFLIYFPVIAIYSLSKNKLNKEIIIKVLVILVLFTVIVSSLTLITHKDYVGEILSLGKEIDKIGTTSFGSYRGMSWKISFEMIERYPMFGAGLECFGLESNDGTYGGEEYINRNDPTYFDKAHSEYLQIASTSGIPSLVVFLTILFTIVIKLFIKIIKDIKNKADTKYSRMTCIVFLTICSYAFQAAANISVTQVAPLYFILLGIGAKISLSKEENEVIEIIDEKEINK